MAFILDYLDKIDIIKKYPTWILAKCPVCEGTLKISVGGYKHGAYACYTNFCHKQGGQNTNLIRDKLDDKYSPFRKKRYVSPFQHSKLNELVTSISLPNTVKPIDFITTTNFIKPLQKRLSTTKLLTVYSYIDFYIVRVDELNEENTKIKYFYPLYKDSEGNKIKELPQVFTNLPVFRKNYLQESVIFVEGEKCATVGQYLGIATITFPAFVYAERYLNRYVSALFDSGVRNVIYLRDNDIVGLTKGKLVTNYLSKHGIANKLVNLVDVYQDFKDRKGYDLFDLYKDRVITKTDSLELLEKLISFRV